MSSPPGVDFEVSDRRRYRRPLEIVEHNQPAGTNQLTQEVEVHEDVVEDVATINERCISDEVLGYQPREHVAEIAQAPTCTGCQDQRM